MAGESDTPPLPLPTGDGPATADLQMQAKNRGRFKPGVSGNPRGKRPGTKHRMTRLAEELLADEAEGIIRKLMEKALAGNTKCLELAMARIWPARRDPPIEFDVPPQIDDLPAALHAVLQAVAAGDMTPAEGAAVAGIINSRAQAVEITKLAERIAAIEETKGGTNGL